MNAALKFLFRDVTVVRSLLAVDTTSLGEQLRTTDSSNLAFRNNEQVVRNCIRQITCMP